MGSESGAPEWMRRVVCHQTSAWKNSFVDETIDPCKGVSWEREEEGEEEGKEEEEGNCNITMTLRATSLTLRRIYVVYERLDV